MVETGAGPELRAAPSGSRLSEREGSANSLPVAIQDVLLQGDEELRLVARISGVDRDGALAQQVSAASHRLIQYGVEEGCPGAMRSARGLPGTVMYSRSKATRSYLG